MNNSSNVACSYRFYMERAAIWSDKLAAAVSPTFRLTCAKCRDGNLANAIGFASVGG